MSLLTFFCQFFYHLSLSVWIVGGFAFQIRKYSSEVIYYGATWCAFKPKLKKKINLALKKFLIFFQINFSYISGNWIFLSFLKNVFVISRETELSHISGSNFLTTFLLLFYQVLRFCVVIPQVLRIWESFFYFQAFFMLYSFSYSPQYRKYYRSERTLFILRRFLTYILSEDLAQTAFINHEGCRASHWGSKHRPSPYLCLNHIVFSKKFYFVGSIYVLRSCRTLYLPLPGFKTTL